MRLVEYFTRDRGRGMFKVLGVLVGAYVAQSILKGEVYAKSGIWGRTVSRTEEPAYYWVVIVIYAVLAGALVTIF